MSTESEREVLAAEREEMARAVHAAIPGTGGWEDDPEHNYIWFEIGDRILAAGFRRPVVPEPSADEREAARVAHLDARQAAMQQDRLDWFPDYDREPTVARDAFVRGWDAAVDGRFRRREEPQGEPSDAQTERRAPLQATRGFGPAGTISWAEHIEVWTAYAALHGDRQSPERIAERGGFGQGEVQFLTGHLARTYQPAVTEQGENR